MVDERARGYKNGHMHPRTYLNYSDKNGRFLGRLRHRCNINIQHSVPERHDVVHIFRFNFDSSE